MDLLGSKQRPAFCRIATREKLNDIKKLCTKNNWYVRYSFDPYLPEDLTEINKLIKFSLIGREWIDKKIGRNKPCPCNSGKKFKKCCLNDFHP